MIPKGVGSETVRLHATAVVVGEAGILLLGPSGSGKSRLARDFLAACEREERHGALVGDDVVLATPRGGRLVVRGAPAIAGLLEVRGIGPVPMPRAEAAVVRLAVELGTNPPRLPEPAELLCTIAGIELPCLRLQTPPDSGLVLLWLSHVMTSS